MKHNNLESGFIKGATEFGVEADCVKGYIKQAEQTYDFCCGVIDQAEKNSKDPGFRQKLAFELLCANMNPEIIKTALEDKRGNELMEMLGKMFSGGGEMFQQGATGLGSALGAEGNSAGGLGGALMGGGGGALTGLLLSKLLGVNPLIGMLLMGSLGAGAGHHFGNKGQTPAVAAPRPDANGVTGDTMPDEYRGTPEVGASQNEGTGKNYPVSPIPTTASPSPHTAGASLTPPGQPQTPAIPTPAPGSSMVPGTKGESSPTPAGGPPDVGFPGKRTSSINNNNDGPLGGIKMPGAQHGINNKPHMPQAWPVPGAGFDHKPRPLGQV